MTDINIRPANPSDVAQIFHVRTSVNENHMSIEEMAAIGITPDSLAEMISSAQCAWVAVQGETVVGFSIIDNDDACLFAAFVLPSHEGMGIGRKVVRCAEDELFKHHVQAWLETAKSSRAAGFYRALGWSNETDIDNGDIRLEKHKPLT